MRCPYRSRAFNSQCELEHGHQALCSSEGDGFSGGWTGQRGFRLALLEEPAAEGRLMETCVVCGKHRQVYKGSRLPCHAACLLTHEEQDRLLDEIKSAVKQAGELGVEVSVIRASHKAAQKRRSRGA